MGLSNAERQARWRARRDARIAAEISALRKAEPLSQEQVRARVVEIALLREQVKLLKEKLAAKPEPAKAAPLTDADGKDLHGKLLKAQFEIDQLRQQLAEARKSEPEQVAALRRHIGALEQELTRRDSAAKAARSKAAKVAAAPVDGEKDPRIAQLEKANSDLRKKIKQVWAVHDESLKSKGLMTFATSSLIAKALHPDATPSSAAREAAFKAFSAWKSDGKAKAR